VAGFNQFFDDFDATRSWRYGIGLDQKLSRAVFAGVEGSRRDLDFAQQVDDEQRATDWKEYLARGYAYWAPLRWVALRAEYSLERLVRDASDPDLSVFGAREVTTHRAPLGVALFHGSGLGASAVATWFNQAGDFGEFAPFTAGRDRFWVVDAALGWRLPRRYGIVSVVATNLLDEGFRLFEPGVNTTVQPGRAVFGRVTLAAP
jgi:hypothetical protein